jgi:hypothetical protein
MFTEKCKGAFKLVDKFPAQLGATLASIVECLSA